MTVLIGVMVICAVTGIVLAIMVGRLGSALTQPGQSGMQALSFEFAGLKISAGTTLVSLYLLCAACILVVPLYILYQQGPLKDQQVILTGSFAQANPLCVHPEEIVVANRRFFIPIHLALQDQHFLVQASDNSFLSENIDVTTVPQSSQLTVRANGETIYSGGYTSGNSIDIQNPIALIDSKSIAKLVDQPQTGGVSQALSNVQAPPGLETAGH
jgi:hypothetical protein